MTRTPERETFYADVLKLGLERRGVQLWPATVENFRYVNPQAGIQYGNIRQGRRGGGNCEAVIRVRDYSNKHDERWAVGINTVSSGFVVLRRWDYDPKRTRVAQCVRNQIVSAFQRSDLTRLDPELCDYVIQLGLFGKVVYGK